MSSPMFNLNGFLIRPDRVCLIAPVKQVPGQVEFAFRVVLDGGYEHVCICPSQEVAVRSRLALVTACTRDAQQAELPPPHAYAAPAARPTIAAAPAAPVQAAHGTAPARTRGKPPRRAGARVN